METDFSLFNLEKQRMLLTDVKQKVLVANSACPEKLSSAECLINSCGDVRILYQLILQLGLENIFVVAWGKK